MPRWDLSEAEAQAAADALREAAGSLPSRGRERAGRRDEGRAMPKRNFVDAARVRELLSQGIKPICVAERLGVNKTSVFKIHAEMRKEQATQA